MVSEADGTTLAKSARPQHPQDLGLGARSPRSTRSKDVLLVRQAHVIQVLLRSCRSSAAALVEKSKATSRENVIFSIPDI